MICGSIYKIIFPNGKHYIGLTTTSLKKRQARHKCSAKNGDTQCLYNALRKYDMIDTFQLIEIDTADTLEKLYEMEIRYILMYDSYYMNENGYNMTYGGEGISGYVCTDDEKQKNSKTKKKYYEEHPEAKQANSEIKKKYYEEHPEAKKVQSEKMKIYYENPEVKKQHSEKMKKYYEEHPECKKKCSESQKKRFVNTEIAKEHSEKMKLYYKNPDSIKKNSEAQKKYYEQHPEAKEHLSNKRKKYYEEHPELKNTLKERMKKYYEEHPELKKEHNEKIKKYYENPESKRKILDKKGQNKPFDIFKIDGTFIKTFTYQFEAKEFLQKEYNINSKKLYQVLSGKQKSCAGFIFKYK
jgi:hypothetical protein